MSELDKERIIRSLRLLDGIRHQLSRHLCRLAAILAESELSSMEDLINDLTCSIEQLSTAVYITRFRLIRCYCLQYPGFRIPETDTDQPSLQNH